MDAWQPGRGGELRPRIASGGGLLVQIYSEVLIQYYEIKKDGRVLEFFDRYFQYLYNKIPKVPMKQWSSARIGDLLYCIQWYCEQEAKGYIHDVSAKYDIHSLVEMYSGSRRLTHGYIPGLSIYKACRVLL